MKARLLKTFPTKILILQVLFLLVSSGLVAENQTYAATRHVEHKSAEAVEPLVGAYYYGWYDTDRWQSTAATFTPSLGHYKSLNASVVDQHIDWAKQAGIDFLMMSWVGQVDPRVGKTIDLVQKESEKRGMHFAILYDTAIALRSSPELIDFASKMPDGSTRGDQFVSDILQLTDTYAKSPAYQKQEGCPIIGIYLTRNLVNQEPAFEKLFSELKQRNECVNLVADVVFWNLSQHPLAHSQDSAEQQWSWLGRYFKAVTGYNMYSNDTTLYTKSSDDARRPLAEAFLKSTGNEYYAWEKMAAAHRMRLYPSIFPGYDDRKLRGYDRPYFARSPEFYAAFWKTAEQHQDKGTIYFITSFNEWHEGTEIEPSLEDKGDYIGLTRRNIAELKQTANRKAAAPKR